VNAELEDGTIVEELQRGFMLNDRVIRPAKVRVSIHPPAQSMVNEETVEENNNV
jgi:ribosomal protein S6